MTRLARTRKPTLSPRRASTTALARPATTITITDASRGSRSEDDVYYLREPLRTTTRHTQTDTCREGGTRGDRHGPAVRGSLRIISGPSGSLVACCTARSAGPFVGTSAAEEDNEDVLRAGRGERRSPLCTPPVNKHLAHVRFGRCLLPAIGSGRAPLLDLIVTRSVEAVAQGNADSLDKQAKKEPARIRSNWTQKP